MRHPPHYNAQQIRSLTLNELAIFLEDEEWHHRPMRGRPMTDQEMREEANRWQAMTWQQRLQESRRR